MTDLLYLFAGLLTGGAIAWVIRTLLAKSEMGMTKPEAEALRTELQQISKELGIAVSEKKAIRDQLDKSLDDVTRADIRNRDLEGEVARLRERNQNLLERLELHKEELLRIQEQMKNEFRVMANEILEEKSTKFTKQNEVNLKILLDPLGERLKEFSTKVEETYTTEMKERVTLQEQIRSLTELNQQMSTETRNLTRALKGDSKVQGNWGEVILERILEKSGLQRDREYRVQVSGNTEEGRRVQPDIIIELPENKQLIIDSKVSITAFERFSSAEEDRDREQALKEHIQSVRAHIKGLSDKNYQNMYEINTPDFVLMFIPIEPAFSLVLQQEPGLYNEAMDKNIVIVSPTTLLATLSTISSIWKQENRTRNALEIARQGGALYDKFVGFVEDLNVIGNRLNQTQKSYDQAMNKLKTGSGNLIKRAEDLRKLEAKTTKRLPQDVIETSEDQESIEE